jgi:hypothetical protein
MVSFMHSYCIWTSFDPLDIFAVIQRSLPNMMEALLWIDVT